MKKILVGILFLAFTAAFAGCNSDAGSDNFKSFELENASKLIVISVDGKRAVQLARSDYAKYDYIIGMDSYNIRNMRRMLPEDTGNKIHRLLDFTMNPRDIADPWYTGDFDATYDDVYEGCQALLKEILKEGH